MMFIDFQEMHTMTVVQQHSRKKESRDVMVQSFNERLDDPGIEPVGFSNRTLSISALSASVVAVRTLKTISRRSRSALEES
jgi:hypothetical protein